MSDEEARSTDRPPAPDDEAAHEIARAVRAAKTSSPGRYGPPQATAKIRPFELAQALALSSADGEVPSGSKPLRDDDAPFVAGEVEVVGEEEVPSGVPGGSEHPAASGRPLEPRAIVAAAAAPTIPPRRSRLGLVVLGAFIGFLVIAYAFVTVNR